ncbi:hypothetical protein BG015_010332 [Linnemannia schmuckeri]|uniref:FAD-binding domain-containing protein n=1 Tax=Linnemannia schmuckeri TaxID=64567 RepID=A0A9P5S8T4_9FUNG|nr:hypothetical protein BG015_010332 [Linnemannia schmuckeri]
MPTSPKTRVLIVGGGLGGLVLAILLQRAGIDYLVLEQSVLIRPIGSVIALSPLVLPLMEQLGLLDEIKRLSKPFGKIAVLRDDLSVVGTIVANSRHMDHQQRYGHYGQCITRPDLHNILLSKIPKERIHLGKRFVNSQNIIDPATGICHQVQVRCSDGSLYSADTLVGADGASSAVRQSLFRQIKEESGNGGHGHGQKPLPKQDQEKQQYRHVALVGVTNPLNLKRYPDLDETFSQFKVILYRHSPYMGWFMPVLGNRYCWLVTRTLEKPILFHTDNFKESEWGPDATDEMCKAIRLLKGPDEGGQGTVGDLIDATDRQLISKVMLEERVFKTWYGGRTVLLGDGKSAISCHKSVPFTGRGGSESMLDAVTLASLLHDNMPQSTIANLTSPSVTTGTSSPTPPTTSVVPPILSNNRHQPDSIHSPAVPSTTTTAITWTVEDLHRKVFKPYYRARISDAQEVVNSSSMFGALLVKDGLLAEVKRKFVFAIQDSWIGRPFVGRAHAHRIQATFLKLAPDRGSVPPSQSQVMVALKKGGDNAGTGVGGGSGEEKEDKYQDMDSPEGRRRLDMQLLQLQQEQLMQQQQNDQHQHQEKDQQQERDEYYQQQHRAIRNQHLDVVVHHSHHQYSTIQNHTQVDEFMAGQSSAIVL